MFVDVLVDLLTYLTQEKVKGDYYYSQFDSGRGASAPFIIFENNQERIEFEKYALDPTNTTTLENLNYDNTDIYPITNKDDSKSVKIRNMIKAKVIFDFWLNNR